MKKYRLWLVAVLAFPLWAGHSLADSTPFATANRTPLVNVLGLPAAEDARFMAAGDRVFALRLEHSSLFTVDDEGPEQVFLDGETSSLTLSYRHALSERWLVGAELPVLSHQSGFMDSFVEGWHSAFGLPNGRRDEFARNQLRYAVTTPEGRLLLNNSASGVGDAALVVQRSLRKSTTSHLAAQLRLELPTGESSELLGSDSVDAALGLNYYNASVFPSLGITFNANLGVVFPGDSDLLPELQNNSVFYANATIAHRFLRDWLTVKLQLETHTAFYDTGIKALGDTSAQLSFGAGINLSKKLVMNIGMSEDIAVRTAPDFTLLVGLSYR